MKNGTVNTFQELVQDFHELVQRNQTYTYALNATLITHDNGEMIIQTERGNTYITSIKPGYVVLGTAELNDVCYIISAEVLGGNRTGKGEIGCFPSPDGNGNLTNDYRPFQNYLPENLPLTPDIINNVENYADFNTELFKFPLRPIELELQTYYDNTVNVFFTDNLNEGRVINSRFRVLPNKKYEYIDRIGNNDSNLYNKESFNNTIKHIQNSVVISSLDFNGITEGGIVKAGQYKFFFKYSTEDNNLTDIFLSSNNVSVFFGDRLTNIRGGKINETTTKAISFTLRDLDTNYRFIKVYFTYAFGENVTTTETFEIESPYTFTDILNFTFTGFEKLTRITTASLSLTNSNQTIHRTMAQVQGRIFRANLSSVESNYERFSALGRAIKLNHVEKEIPLTYDLPDGSSDSVNVAKFNKSIDNEDLGNKTYNMGYTNPQNIYHNTGYFGGESYPFGIVLMLTDGTVTPVIPVKGIDNLYNQSEYNDLIKDDFYVFNNVNDSRFKNNGQNNLGLYRFPSRTFSSKILETNGNGSFIRAFGITFSVPEIPADLKPKIKAIMFVRGDRFKNLNFQGNLINTALIPNIDNRNFTNDLGTIAKYPYTRLNDMRFVPAIDNMIEAHEIGPDGGDDIGITPSSIYFAGFRTSTQSATEGIFKGVPEENMRNTKRFAVYSPDFINNPTAYNQLNNLAKLNLVSAAKYRPKFNQQCVRNETTFNVAHHYESESYNPSPKNETIVNANITWVEEGKDFINSDNFATVMLTRGQFPGANLKYDNKFNSYVGVNIEPENNNIGIYVGSPTPSPSDSSGQISYIGATRNRWSTAPVTNGFEQGNKAPVSFTVNIYDNGLFTTQNLKDIVNLNNVGYFPISNFIPLDQVENQTLTFFNGDCYIGHTFRQLYHRVSEFGENQDTKPSTGVVMSFLNESIYNPYLRNENIFDVNEGLRSYFPFSKQDVFRSSQDIYGRDSLFRKRIFETSYYNKGFAKTDSEQNLIAIPSNTPFVQNYYPTRIQYSDIYVNNSFENGYRKFQGLSFLDYGTNYGQIVKLINFKDRLISVFEQGVAFIGVNERSLVGKDVAGGIFVEQSGILHPKPYMVSDVFGSQHQFSITKTDNSVYGVDMINAKIWRIAGDKLDIISDFKIQSFLRSIQSFYKNKEEMLLNVSVKSYFDSRKKDVIFCFYNYPATKVAEQGYQEYSHTIKKVETIEEIKVVDNQIVIETRDNDGLYPDEIVDFCPVQPTPTQLLNQYIVTNHFFTTGFPETTSYSIQYTGLPTNIAPRLLSFAYRSNDTEYVTYTDAIMAFGNGTRSVSSFESGTTYNVVLGTLFPGADIKDRDFIFTYTNGMQTYSKVTSGRDVFNERGGTRILQFLRQSVVSVKTDVTGVKIQRDINNSVRNYTPNDPVNRANLRITMKVYDLNNTLIQTYTHINDTTQIDINFNTSGRSLIETRIDKSLLQETGYYKVELTTEIQQFLNGSVIISDTQFTPTLVPGNRIYKPMEEQSFYFYYDRDLVERLNSGPVIRPLTHSCQDVYKSKKIENILEKDKTNYVTFVYNEMLSKWITFASYAPHHMFNVDNTLYSLNSITDENKIWQHGTLNYCNYYDEQGNFAIEYIVNEQSQVQKIFTNLKMITNKSLPIKVSYKTEFLDVEEETVPRKNGNIIAANIEYKENHVYFQITKNKDKRIRDKYVKIKIVYTGKDFTYIQAIQTLFTVSYS